MPLLHAPITLKILPKDKDVVRENTVRIVR